jgi:cation diffusion facilitator family transporter
MQRRTAIIHYCHSSTFPLLKWNNKPFLQQQQRQQRQQLIQIQYQFYQHNSPINDNNNPIIKIHHQTIHSSPSTFHQHGSSLSHNNNYNSNPDQLKQKYKITILGLLSNISLATLKLITGFLTQSNALISDGVHSVSDGASDIITLVSIHLSSKKPDPTHPYGWGSYESVGSFTLGLTLISAGLWSGLESSQALLSLVNTSTYALSSPPSTMSNHASSPGEIWNQLAIPAFSVAVLSVVVKEALYLRTMSLARKTNSPVLVASAYHHRADSLSTVVAGAGILAAGLVHPIFDPIGGFIVSGMVIKSGFEVTLDSIYDLTGKQKPDQKQLAHRIQALVQNSDSREEIVTVHNIRIRKLGPSLTVDLHIVVVDPLQSVTAAYNAGQRLRAKIQEQFGVDDVFVFVDAGKNAFQPPPSPTTMISQSSLNHNNLTNTVRSSKDDDDDHKTAYHQHSTTPTTTNSLDNNNNTSTTTIADDVVTPLLPPAPEIIKKVNQLITTLDHPFIEKVAHCTAHYVVENDSNHQSKQSLILEVNLLIKHQVMVHVPLSELFEMGNVVRNTLERNLGVNVKHVDLHVQLP